MTARWSDCTVSIGGIDIEPMGFSWNYRPKPAPIAPVVLTASFAMDPGAAEALFAALEPTPERAALCRRDFADRITLARSSARRAAIAAKREAARAAVPASDRPPCPLPKKQRMPVARAWERIERTAPKAKSQRRCALEVWRARMGRG